MQVGSLLVGNRALCSGRTRDGARGSFPTTCLQVRETLKEIQHKYVLHHRNWTGGVFVTNLLSPSGIVFCNAPSIFFLCDWDPPAARLSWGRHLLRERSCTLQCYVPVQLHLSYRPFTVAHLSSPGGFRFACSINLQVGCSCPSHAVVGTFNVCQDSTPHQGLPISLLIASPSPLPNFNPEPLFALLIARSQSLSIFLKPAIVFRNFTPRQTPTDTLLRLLCAFPIP